MIAMVTWPFHAASSAAPNGARPSVNATQLLPKLKRLMAYARWAHVPTLSCVDARRFNEVGGTPHRHCVVGTCGQQKIGFSLLPRRIMIESDNCLSVPLDILLHYQQAIFTVKIDDELSQMVGDVVERYKDHPNLYAWQVENEALFPFGNCPEWSKHKGRKRLKGLIKQVAELDPDHKVTTSDSGELSTWMRTVTLPIDSLSLSMYRVAYNEKNGYFYWPVNPYFYKLHFWLVKPFVKESIISELQMEPWGPDTVDNLSIDEVYKSFPPQEFDERMDFAQRTGADVILGWGVEWWYYMKEIRGNSDYWDKAIEYFTST